jgi:glyoxylase-like metal-dependent hydrolase (beta-lactamase superfamily II)
MSGLIYGVVLGALLAAGAGRGDDEFINIERLSPRVLLAYWVGPDRRCNLTVLQTQKGLVIIDTEMSPRIMAPIKAKIERVLGRSDWTYVINTHAHDSHPGGNSLFKGAVIVGHENLWADMQWIIRRQTEPDAKRDVLAQGDRYMQHLRTLLPRVGRNSLQSRLIRGEIRFSELYQQDMREGYPVVRPALTFADRHTLDMGDVTLELVFFGKGHSNSDIVTYVPQERLLVSGAVAYQRRQVPEIAEETTWQDFQRFLTVLNSFLADDVKIDRVIPSHSPPLVKQDLVAVRDYYQRMLITVQAARKEGLTLEQTRARLVLRSNFPAMWEAPPGAWSHGFHERNLKNLWRILDEEQRQPKTEQGQTEASDAVRDKPQVPGAPNPQ